MKSSARPRDKAAELARLEKKCANLRDLIARYEREPMTHGPVWAAKMADYYRGKLAALEAAKPKGK